MLDGSPDRPRFEVRDARGGKAYAAVACTVLGVILTGCTGEDMGTTGPLRPAASSGSSTLSPSPSSTSSTPQRGDATDKSTEGGAEGSRTPQKQQRLDAELRDAAWINDVPRARQLIAHGADVDAKDETEQNAYLIATSEGYYEFLELTLRAGADVNAKDSFNGTGVIRAAERGHWRIVGRLVAEGVPVNHVNNLGWTALHEAVFLGDGSESYLDTVRVLVAADADVALPSARDGITPVQHAEANGLEAIARLLRAAARIEAGDRGGRGGGQRVLNAAAAGNANGVAVALRTGAKPEVRDSQARTPLLLAAAADHLDVARVLVALGANPDALDARHDTPWLVTGVTGSVPMGRLLLAAHPDLTIRNRFGGVSVIPASERGHVAYVRWVTTHTGIDLNHINDLGWTALLEAVILGDGSRPYQEIVRILLDAGADPDIADGDGVNALHHAEASDQAAVARILRGAR